MSSFNKLSTLHRYGLFEKGIFEQLVREQSHIVIPFGKYSHIKYKKTIKSVLGYIFYIHSTQTNMEITNRYSLTNILNLLYNNKELFVEFIRQMNIYFNEKQIIHNNYFSIDEINEILIQIYINEITTPETGIIDIPPTVDVLLDMVEMAVTETTTTLKKKDNPFSDFIFCDPSTSTQPNIKLLDIPETILPKPKINIITTRPPQNVQSNVLRNTKEKYKKKSIPLVLKRRVWDKYFGEKNGVAQCPCCKLSQISTFSFHCGHIVSEKNGGLLVLDNLIPLCQSCNSSMGIRSYNDFCKDIGIPNHIVF